MIINANGKEITVSSIISTTIRRNGKIYPALKFIFADAVTTEDVAALTSGNIIVNEDAHEGYTTLDEISLTVGKITTAEQQRDEIESELTAAKAEHEEYKVTVSTILPILDDETALGVKALFPVWEIGKAYKTGERVLCSAILYKIMQDHTSQADWIPGIGTESLYKRIDETHSGTVDDPIPYDGNMELAEGSYYSQNSVVYLCTRSTGTAVYNALDELVGIYVEVNAA